MFFFGFAMFCMIDMKYVGLEALYLTLCFFRCFKKISNKICHTDIYNLSNKPINNQLAILRGSGLV